MIINATKKILYRRYWYYSALHIRTKQVSSVVLKKSSTPNDTNPNVEKSVVKITQLYQ